MTMYRQNASLKRQAVRETPEQAKARREHNRMLRERAKTKVNFFILRIEGYLEPGEKSERRYPTQEEAQAVARRENLPRYSIVAVHPSNIHELLVRSLR